MSEEVEIAAKKIHSTMVQEFRFALISAEDMLRPFTDQLDVVLGFASAPLLSKERVAEIEKQLESVAMHRAQRAFVELILEKARG